MATDWSAKVNALSPYIRIRAAESTPVSAQTSLFTDLVLGGHTMSQANAPNRGNAAANDAAFNNKPVVAMAAADFYDSSLAASNFKFLTDGSDYWLLFIGATSTTSQTLFLDNYTGSTAHHQLLSTTNDLVQVTQDASGNLVTYVGITDATNNPSNPFVLYTRGGSTQTNKALMNAWLGGTLKTAADPSYGNTPAATNPGYTLSLGGQGFGAGAWKFAELIIGKGQLSTISEATLSAYAYWNYGLYAGVNPADVSALLPELTFAGSAVISAVPGIAASVSALLPELTAVASATIAGPAITASIVATLPELTFAGSAVTLDPLNLTPSIAATLPELQCGAIALILDPPSPRPTSGGLVNNALSGLTSRLGRPTGGQFVNVDGTTFTSLNVLWAIAATLPELQATATAAIVPPAGAGSIIATLPELTCLATAGIAAPQQSVTASIVASLPLLTAAAAATITAPASLLPVGGPGGYSTIVANDVFGVSSGGNFTSVAQFNTGAYGSAGAGWDLYARAYGDTSTTASAAMGSDHLEIYPTGTSKPSWLVSHLELLPTASTSYYFEWQAACGRGGGGAFDGNTAWPAIWFYAGNGPALNDQQSELDVLENYCDLAFGSVPVGGLYTQYFNTTVHAAPSHSVTDGSYTTLTTGNDVTVNYNVFGCELTLVSGQVHWKIYLNGTKVQEAGSGKNISWASSAPAMFLGWNQGSSPYTPAIFKLKYARVWSK